MKTKDCNDCGAPATLVADFKSGPGGRDQVAICEDCATGWWEFLGTPHIYGGILYLTEAGTPDTRRPLWEPSAGAKVSRRNRGR